MPAKFALLILLLARMNSSNIDFIFPATIRNLHRKCLASRVQSSIAHSYSLLHFIIDFSNLSWSPVKNFFVCLQFVRDSQNCSIPYGFSLKSSCTRCNTNTPAQPSLWLMLFQSVCLLVRNRWSQSGQVSTLSLLASDFYKVCHDCLCSFTSWLSDNIWIVLSQFSLLRSQPLFRQIQLEKRSLVSRERFTHWTGMKRPLFWYYSLRSHCYYSVV